MFGIDNNCNNYIVDAKDYGSIWFICRAIKDLAQTTANYIDEEIIFKFGVPKEILTDHGTSFQANLYESYAKLLILRN
jgi:hypothetical protein